MKLTPAQSQIISSTSRFRVVNCGRRFGKTTLAVLEMVANAISDDNRQVCYIAPTFQQARDIAWQELKKVAGNAILTPNESRLEITLRTTKGGTSTIKLQGWESIETLRGQKFHFVVVDEIASMRNWASNWQEVIRPTLTDYKGGALFISTPKGFNHFYDLYNLESKDGDYKSFHFTTYDNVHIPPEEVDKAKLELTEDRFAQEYLADFRKTEGLVYKEFDRDRHIFDNDDVQNVTEFIAGVDFGFTNPCAVIHIKKDYDNNYWVVSEYYQRGRTDEQIGDYVKSCRFNIVYADPENPSAISVLNAKGINIGEVIKGKGSIQTGINKVRNLFKRNKIRIHKDCVNLISELETYSYPDKKADRNEEENPIKENDHAMDALRYAISMNQPDDHPEEIRMAHLMHRARIASQTNNAR
jgi:PBSX family phage terminase large subunit